MHPPVALLRWRREWRPSALMEHNEAFQAEYNKVVNRFTGEFITDFCQPDGEIIWGKLVRFNSGQEVK
jgi:hypothetical protein